MADVKPAVKEAVAHARHVHVSPRKLRLLADLIRKTPVDRALEQLKFSSKRGAEPLAKVINSAVANAVHNFDMKKEDLYIKALTVDGGPVLKRYAPRAQGRAFIERKRTSHISVWLESRPRKASSKRSIFSLRPKTASEVKEHEEHKHEHDGEAVQPRAGKVEQEKPQVRQAPKSQEKIKRNLVNLKRRLFNRKSGE